MVGERKAFQNPRHVLGPADAKGYGSRPQKLSAEETIAELERAYRIYSQSSDARQMLDFVDAEKSWVFVGTKVKCLAKTASDRLAYLARQRKGLSSRLDLQSRRD
jgi:hypothetical protein